MTQPARVTAFSFCLRYRRPNHLNALRFTLGIFSGKLFFYCKQASPAELACLLFHRKSCFLCRERSRRTGFIAFIKIIAAGDAPLGQRQGGVFRVPPPYLWTPLSPQRVKGFSPLTIPKMRSKPKNASRFAKRIFLCFSHLRLRRRFHVSAGRYRQQRGNTSCEAASRRNEKKAFSAAASFFPFRHLLRDYQGRAALDSCLPRLESSGCFSGSLLARKRELSPNAKALCPRATGATTSSKFL